MFSVNFFILALAGGFAGSFHCIGMCGGFACGLAQANTGSKHVLLVKTALYNSGRLTSYVFIGALAGLLGQSLIGHAGTEPLMLSAMASAHASESTHGMGMVLAGEVGLAQRLLSVSAGLLMIFMSLQLFGIHRHRVSTWARLGGVSFARVLHSLVRSNHPGASIALGVANGFLPCPLVLAFAATAAASASVSTGALTMLAFGLGTFPAMLFMSGVGLAVPAALRQRGVRLAGGFVLALGLITIARGVMSH